MKIVIAGGTGFIGKEVVKRLLDRGHDVVVLSRRINAFKDVASSQLKIELWDAKTAGLWKSQLDGADAVINLTGEGIAGKRWTRPQKQILRNSRLESAAALIEAIRSASNKPKTLINASAVGFYGSVPEGDVTEKDIRGRGFLADLCAEWEAEAMKAAAMGLRVVLLRIGIVLEKDGGALQKFIPPFQFYVGGPLGSGKQWFPWVHKMDVVGAILFSLDHATLDGPVNVTAPGVLTMKDFCAALGKAMNRPSWAPVPAFALQILLGEMAGMLTDGQRAVPKRLTESGFKFRYPEANQALSKIFA